MNDLISRQLALNLFKKDDNLYWDINEGYIAPHYVRELLKILPSVQPERKGQWIQLTCDSAEWWYCSECNGRVQMNPWVKYNYCPNCGTDMRGEEHE